MSNQKPSKRWRWVLLLLIPPVFVAALAYTSGRQIHTDPYQFLKGYSLVRLSLNAGGEEFQAQGYEARTYYIKGSYRSICAKAESELVALRFKKERYRYPDIFSWSTAKRSVTIGESSDEYTLVYCASGAPDGLWTKCRILYEEALRPYRDWDYGMVRN